MSVRTIRTFFVATLAGLLCLPLFASAHGIDPAHAYAWGENVGWLNFGTSEGVVDVPDGDGALSGYVWGENTGWLSLSCANTSTCGAVSYGVSRSGNSLTGYAWGENVGWVSFSCTNTNSCGTVSYGVTMDDSTGVLSGYAWGENIGWIVFNCATTNSCASVDYDVVVNLSATPTPSPTPTPAPSTSPGAPSGGGGGPIGTPTPTPRPTPPNKPPKGVGGNQPPTGATSGGKLTSAGVGQTTSHGFAVPSAGPGSLVPTSAPPNFQSAAILNGGPFERVGKALDDLLTALFAALSNPIIAVGVAIFLLPKLIPIVFRYAKRVRKGVLVGAGAFSVLAITVGMGLHYGAFSGSSVSLESSYQAASILGAVGMGDSLRNSLLSWFSVCSALVAGGFIIRAMRMPKGRKRKHFGAPLFIARASFLMALVTVPVTYWLMPTLFHELITVLFFGLVIVAVFRWRFVRQTKRTTRKQ